MWSAIVPSLGGKWNKTPMRNSAILAWPEGSVPAEVFDLIIRHLRLSDVRNMRLVCREFQQKTLANFVHTVATQFKPEFCLSSLDLAWSLRGHSPTFLGQYGHHVRRFMMCLEVDEDELSCLPIKPDLKLVPSYWGFYLWPNDENRYPGLMQLETAADDTQGMKAALRLLVNVTDISISCDPGWGRLLGPERQFITARVLDDHCRAIGLPTVRDRPPSQHSHLPEAPKSFAEKGTKRREMVLKRMVLNAGIAMGDLDSVMDSANSLAMLTSQESVLEGSEPGLVPVDLNMPQQEFLMEWEWASRAFVQSWAIAVSDLSWEGDFPRLSCLRLAKISSSHLPIFTSAGFWSSLPTVNEVHLQVLADWRRVSRNQGTGLVNLEPVEPVEAAADTFELIRLISEQRNITALHFEWICGGELSWGSQRGRYILPVPFTRLPEQMTRTDTVFDSTQTLSFPHIRDLSLKNCWCTPQVFIHVLRNMASSCLVELKLESVSLSGPTMTMPDEEQGSSPLRRRLERLAMLRFPPRRPPRPPSIPEPAHPGTPSLVPSLPQMPTPGSNTSVPPGPEPANPPPPSLSTLFTWPGIINLLGRGPKAPNFFNPTNPTNPGSTIERIEFKSCGYVAVENLCINTSHLSTWDSLAFHYRWANCELDIPWFMFRGMPAHFTGLPVFLHHMPAVLWDLENASMQSSWSELNGWVVPFLPDEEGAALTDVFGMQMGWEGVYDAQTIELAKAVNPSEPGQGRFSGVVARSKGS